jgi:hypothetical protein
VAQQGRGWSGRDDALVCAATAALHRKQQVKERQEQALQFYQHVLKMVLQPRQAHVTASGMVRLLRGLRVAILLVVGACCNSAIVRLGPCQGEAVLDQNQLLQAADRPSL